MKKLLILLILSQFLINCGKDSKSNSTYNFPKIESLSWITEENKITENQANKLFQENLNLEVSKNKKYSYTQRVKTTSNTPYNCSTESKLTLKTYTIDSGQEEVIDYEIQDYQVINKEGDNDCINDQLEEEREIEQLSNSLLAKGIHNVSYFKQARCNGQNFQSSEETITFKSKSKNIYFNQELQQILIQTKCSLNYSFGVEKGNSSLVFTDLLSLKDIFITTSSMNEINTLNDGRRANLRFESNTKLK